MLYQVDVYSILARLGLRSAGIFQAILFPLSATLVLFLGPLLLRLSSNDEIIQLCSIFTQRIASFFLPKKTPASHSRKSSSERQRNYGSDDDEWLVPRDLLEGVYLFFLCFSTCKSQQQCNLSDSLPFASFRRLAEDIPQMGRAAQLRGGAIGGGAHLSRGRRVSARELPAARRFHRSHAAPLLRRSPSAPLSRAAAQRSPVSRRTRRCLCVVPSISLYCVLLH